MQPEHYAALDQSDRGYWWFAVRFAQARKLLDHRVAGGTDLRPNGLLLDMGCGTGGFLADILERGWLRRENVIGAEPSSSAHESLARRNVPALQLGVADLSADNLPRQPDAITLMDVLEHLPEPVVVLRQLHSIAARGARLVVMVPAFPFLWSAWDDKLGHQRRYTNATLASDIEKAGWRIVDCRYIFGSMFLPALLRARLIQSQRMPERDFPAVPRVLNAILTAWYKLENRILRLPLGTSVVALAIKDS